MKQEESVYTRNIKIVVIRRQLSQVSQTIDGNIVLFSSIVWLTTSTSIELNPLTL